MLLAPPRGGKKHNLITIIKSRLVTNNYNNAIKKSCKTYVKNDLASLTASVKAKIEDGNLKAALRLLSSEDKPAEDNDTTISALKARHPQAASDRKVSPSPQEYTALQVFKYADKTVIRSFRADSSGGPDSIRSQHILDMINNNKTGPALLTSITNFVNRLLRDNAIEKLFPFCSIEDLLL